MRHLHVRSNEELNDCPDSLVLYFPRFDEYSLPIRDGGSAAVPLRYCPWCGVRLPESKQARWFEELEARGLKYPEDAEAVPEDYWSDRWHRTPPKEGSV